MTCLEHRYEHLSSSSADLAARRKGSTLIWPFGACEQHGPQLPLATDALFADRILDLVLSRLDSELPIWRLPLLPIGFSPEHQSFSGTLSFSSNLLIQLVADVGSQLASMGWSRLLLFNAHGGQIALLEVAARQLRVNSPNMGVLPCFLWSVIESLEPLIKQSEWENGLHAGQAETSLMLHLAPELVGPERPFDGLVSPPEGWSLEGPQPCAWLSNELTTSGVIGDSRNSTAELGASIEKLLISGWKRRLETLLVSDWPPTIESS